MQLPIEPNHPCYHDDEAARLQLETIRWPNGPYCPYCGSFDRVKPTVTPNKAKGGGWHRCQDCRRNFTVRVGSIFHRSHVPLHKWLLAFRLVAGSKKGISAHQLHRHLRVDYKTAWFLEHRIRECMDEDDNGPLGGEGKIVEADETFLNKQRGRGVWEFSTIEQRWVLRRDRRSVPVFALIERGGKVRAMPIDNTTSDELRRALRQHADKKSRLMTDEWQAYRRPGREITKPKNGRAAKPARRPLRTSFPCSRGECAAPTSIARKSIWRGICTNLRSATRTARRLVLRMRNARRWQSKVQPASG
jgi:transposase-like protein